VMHLRVDQFEPIKQVFLNLLLGFALEYDSLMQSPAVLYLSLGLKLHLRLSLLLDLLLNLTLGDLAPP